MLDVTISPVEVFLLLIGPPAEVAQIVQRHRTAVVKWKRLGRIPSDSQRMILAYARDHSIPLTGDHLIAGATEAELAALQPAEVAAE